jgi:hypothetical protein
MQTGQNSIAPENSLPQLGQVRWGSALMDLTVLQSHSEPKATPRSTEWCESGKHSAWQTVVPLHALGDVMSLGVVGAPDKGVTTRRKDVSRRELHRVELRAIW